jgi:transposase
MIDLSGFSREEVEALLLQSLEGNARSARRIALLEREIARLRGGGPASVSGWSQDAAAAPEASEKAVPEFVRANRAPRERKERKRRAQGFGRKYSAPTETQEHSLERCPDCGRLLSEGADHGIREVIELERLSVKVLHHVLKRSWCGACRKHRMASVDVSAEVVGKSRMGVGLMSTVAYEWAVSRLPVETIQRNLKDTSGLDISEGQIVGILQRVAEKGVPLYDSIREKIRSSKYIHADETGWREDGLNGYLWGFSVPDARYFVHNKSRGHQIPEAELGAGFRGVLVSDFYSAYSFYLGEHQRCWVHMARDLHDLKKKHPCAAVTAWADGVLSAYHDAKAFSSTERRKRVRARERFQVRVSALARPYARTDLPQHVLAERIERFLPELFTFVEHPEVPSDNNAAQRSLRPSVVARKIRGGTRSERGSRTAAILMSLFGTWTLQGANCLDACRQMLASAA